VNPIVLGAIIGAVPALITAGLAAWAASRVNNRTLAAEHSKWLRDKRSDVYVEMSRALHDAQMSINYIGPKSSPKNLRELAEEGKKFRTEKASDLTARLFAYGTNAAYETCIETWAAERRVWVAVEKELADGDAITLGESLKKEIDDFQENIWSFLQIVVKEIQTFRGQE
jgi:hypothetical protein